ncbi:MAG TPA: hypothetical protein VM364_17415 [Vicinamibacterales bacterium]|nr:hypothetical protein [Vicinamibacterales bacterium]
MALRLALLLVSIPLLVHGGEGLLTALRSGSQAHVTCAQLAREGPPSRWLHVSDCEIDYVRAAYRERQGRITELFFPLRPTGWSLAEPAPLVIATRDPQVLAIAEATIGGEAPADREAFLVMMLKVVTALRAAREVEGTTRSWLEMLRTRRDLRVIKAPLAEHFTVLDLNRRPSLLFPALETAAGAHALLVFTILSTVRRRAAKRGARLPRVPPPVAVENPRPTPAAQSDALHAVPAAASRGEATDLRHLMLLNLPPDATPAALESAPPLGTINAVRAALERVLPGISFTDAGVGQFNRPDHQLRFEIGRGPIVPTAILDATGDAAAAAVKRLMTQTSWRAYSPRSGRFLTSDDLS